MFTKTLLVYFILYFLSDFAYGQQDKKFFRTDYNYIETTQGFYKIHTTKQTWADAKRVCALEGASLFYAENRDEANAVISWWKTVQPNVKWAFVGISDIITEGKFETIDGKLVSEVYNQWMRGEPNDGGPAGRKQDGDEDCVHLKLSGDLNDYPCEKISDFICKKSLASIDWNDLCKMHHLDGQRDKKFFRTDYNYIETTQGFYKIHTTKQTWAGANRVCALEGASLFYPENRDEANAVISWWKTVQPYLGLVFVGISDIITEGKFETIDGRLVSEVYNQWQRGDPNNLHGNEDCVHLTLSGHLNDYSCDAESHFICKKSLASLEWNDLCNMLQLGYTYSEDTGKFYKLHTTPLTWTMADTACRTEQTHLAVINNQLEAAYLANFTKSASRRRIEGNYLEGIFHAGFHNTLNKGWQTVRGTPIPSDASLWWDNDVPTEDEHKQCGSMFYTGSLNIVNCATRSLFICEREIDAVRLDARNNLSNMKLTN